MTTMQETRETQAPLETHGTDPAARPDAAPPAARRRLRLLPADRAVGWVPFAWLIYLPTFLVDPVFGRHGPWYWGATALGIVVFLAAYFRGYWVQGRQLLGVVGVLALLGTAYAPFNVGASVFYIYAASFAARYEDGRVAARLVAGLTALVAAMTWLTHPPFFSWIPAMVFTPLIGGVSLHFAQVARANAKLLAAQREVVHLAAVAERERIARDLHDLLGHTLSLITLKAELAGKLAERDPARAAREIRDVEQVSRRALQEVREAIRGYRATLAEELVRVRSLLGAAHVRLDADLPAAGSLGLDRAREEVLALALREAATNVARHAEAQVCRVQLTLAGDACTLVVEDDGCGGAAPEGSGLRGMRERVEAAGGSVRRESVRGTVLTVMVPVADIARGEARKA